MSSAPRPKLAEPKSFSGALAIGTNTLPLAIRIGIDSSGEVEFEFDPIPLSDATKFILMSWYEKGDEFRYFSFKGVAEDGARFETDDLHLTGVNTARYETGTVLRLRAGCRKARLHFKLSEPAELPVLRMRLKGFENLGSLHGECPLGRIAMSGEHSVEDKNAVIGFVVVHAATVPEDAAAWRAEAEKLLEHIRRIMSLAASAFLRAPVFEFFNGADAEVAMWSQTRQDGAGFRVVHFLAQQDMFDAALRSFFNPPVAVNKLFFAIEWFGINATYNEVRLIAAMTALEILIDANAIDTESLIQRPKEFDKTRSALRAVIRKCLAKQSVENAEGVLKELNEKLVDLSRRSLLAKLDLLAKRWAAPLDGLEDGLRAAKNARDRVVHRGQYYDDAKEADADLWTHVTIVREVVVRFLLTAIGYKGRYISYIGDHHDVDFPPAPVADPAADNLPNPEGQQPERPSSPQERPLRQTQWPPGQRA